MENYNLNNSYEGEDYSTEVGEGNWENIMAMLKADGISLSPKNTPTEENTVAVENNLFTMAQADGYTPLPVEQQQPMEQEQAMSETPATQEEADVQLAEEAFSNTTVQIGPFDTDLKWSDIPGGEEIGSFLINLGWRSQHTWRGAKQMLGWDIEDEKFNEKVMKSLGKVEGLETSSMAGQIAGFFTDVGAIAIPVARAKTIVGAAASAAAASGLVSWAGYVDEEEGESRILNGLIGATTGAVLGAGIQGIRQATTKSRVITNPKEEWANEMADILMSNPGKVDEATAASKLREARPDLHAAMIEEVKKDGVVPDVAGSIKNIEKIRAEQANIPIDTIKPKTSDGALNTVDRWLGLTMTQVRNIDKRVGGKLQLMEVNLKLKPEQMKERAMKFTDMFPPSMFDRTIRDKKAPKFSESQITDLKELLVNNKRDEAIRYVTRSMGPSAADSMKDVFKMIDEQGKQLVEFGVIKQKQLVNGYWPRTISWANREKMLADSVNGISEDGWKAVVKKQEAAIKRPLSNEEEGKLFEYYVLYKGDKTKVSLASNRIPQVPDKLLAYYDDPVTSLHSYIHRSTKEIEKARFLGKDSYSQGMSKATNGLFNMDEAIKHYRLQGDFENLHPIDRENLITLIRERFDAENTRTSGAMRAYRQIVHGTLLGNVLSAVTQLGDLGTSVMFNGFRNTLRGFVHGITGRNSKIGIEDLGLDLQKYTEFADYKGSTGDKIVDALFKGSFFSFFDRVGKRTFMQGALLKASEAAKNPGSSTYKKTFNNLKEMYGSDMAYDIMRDLKKYNGKVDTTTENIQIYALSQLFETQPINLSETNKLFTTPGGKVFGVLKSFLVKQIDVLRRNAYNEMRDGYRVYKSGDKAAGLKQMATGTEFALRYMYVLGLANMSQEKIKEILVGDYDIADLPEDVQNALTVEFASTMLTIPQSTFKMLGFDSYLVGSWARDGIESIPMKYVVPPLPIANEVVAGAIGAGKMAIADSQGYDSPEGAEEMGEAANDLLRYFPILGRYFVEIQPEKDERSGSWGNSGGGLGEW